MSRIATVISYCTNDERFIRRCIENALKATDYVSVIVSDHLFDGTPENMESVSKLASEYPEVNFGVFEWTEGKHPRYWHNTSRILGCSSFPEDSSIEWVLFLDSDEIIEPELFNKFKQDSTFEGYDSYKLACYWYFREENYRATSWEDSPVLVRKRLANFNPDNLYLEREQVYEALDVMKRRLVTQDGVPMIHHYSWVRTKEQMLQKVKAWGHSSDKDWIALIEEEFSRPFNGKCFVNNYEFDTIK